MRLPSDTVAAVRDASPLVHCMTNIVVANFQANGLLALGASPIMADSSEEAAAIASLASCTLLNIGTLDPQKIEAMILAGKSARAAGNPLTVLETALRGGITCFQLREKGPAALTGLEKTAFAESCLRLCRAFGVPFIINDDVELAVQIEADGVHVGQEDRPAKAVRGLIGPDRILGVSVHSEDEAAAAVAAGADYVGMGPVYATRSKADARDVAGTSAIRAAAGRFPELPIVGIGGITAERSPAVLAAGASGVAVISAIAASPDAEQAASAFLSAMAQREARV